MLAAGLGGNPVFRQRFHREADLAARLDHPNIVAVQDAGIDGDAMWIAMQYVDGDDAAKIVRESPGPLPAEPIVDLIGQAASALDHAHAQGTLHRDVKPANILVTPSWAQRAPSRRALLADFGVARLLTESTGLTGTGNVVGTMAYAAPEMFSTDPMTPAVDIYALGCTLFELLAGSTVFPPSDVAAMIRAHAYDPVPRLSARRPDLPVALDGVIARALAKNPEDRYPTAGALAADATAALAGPPTMIRPDAVTRHVTDRQSVSAPQSVPVPVPASQPVPPSPSVPRSLPPTLPPTLPPPVGPGHRRNATPWLLAGVAIVLLIAIASVVAVIVMSDDDSSAPTPADPTTPTTAASQPLTTSSAATPASLAGNWRGAVGGDQTGFDVVAQINPGSPVTATVRYPQLGCSGTWTETGRQGSTVALTETIDQGTCVTSQITLTPAVDGTLSYRSSYFAQSQQRTFVITSTLTRI
ncbi:serine/threonine-protein kinase [Gordonia sp. NPDC003950]